MKLLFTGDINFREKTFSLSEAKETLKEVCPCIDSVDYVIPNLECPLASKEKYKPIKKSGPNLICSPDNVAFLKAMNTYAVTLANNHIGDYGEGAIKETLELLQANNILYAGAGENIKEAYKAFRIEKDGVSVSVISVCENEFGMATETEYGSAGYNPRRLLSQIKAEKESSGFVIVVFHGGNEFNPLPSPDTVDRCRFICDMGADAVIGGHTHCPQGYEIYDGKPIVYSMGNFLFKSRAQRNENDSWYYGYMSALEITDSISLSVLPYKFNIEADKVMVFKDEEKHKMLNYIEILSEIIKDADVLEKYFSGWGWSHQWCPMLPQSAKDPGAYNISDHYNLVHCEAHLSQLTEALKVYQNEKEKEAELYSEKIKQLSEMPV